MRIGVDNTVLGFAVLLSAVASSAFGLAPAWFAANSNLQASLREGGGRAGESGNRRRARNVLAAGEIALAMVLLVAAGLLLRSFGKLMAVSPGFDATAHCEGRYFAAAISVFEAAAMDGVFG